jgi:hypothetical protein
VIVVGGGVINTVVPLLGPDVVVAFAELVPTVIVEPSMVLKIVFVGDSIVVAETENAKRLLLVVDMVAELSCGEDVVNTNVALVGLGERKLVVVVGDSSVSSLPISCLMTKAFGLPFLLFRSGIIVGIKRTDSVA